LIGARDVLDIRVFRRPELSRDAVRVDERGMIQMPLIGEVQAACRTEGEVAAEIAERYRRYLRRPQVDVFIKEYNSQQVAIIGAVRAPGRFLLQRRIRLLELLSLAGGPTDRAGRRLQIIRAAGPAPCAAEGSAAEDGDGIAFYDLRDALRGDSDSNPYLLPGDIVTLPEADQVYIVGNVLHPSAIPLTEQITVSRAIAIAGGTLPDTKADRVRIIRQAPTGKTEIYVDLKAIDRRQAEDVALQANDIIEVPTSAGKRLIRSLLGGLVPNVGMLPVRVVR
jgi:polysaccharide export outer membrane protein